MLIFSKWMNETLEKEKRQNSYFIFCAFELTFFFFAANQFTWSTSVSISYFFFLRSSLNRFFPTNRKQNGFRTKGRNQKIGVFFSTWLWTITSNRDISNLNFNMHCCRQWREWRRERKQNIPDWRQITLSLFAKRAKIKIERFISPQSSDIIWHWHVILTK